MILQAEIIHGLHQKVNCYSYLDYLDFGD